MRTLVRTAQPDEYEAIGELTLLVAVDGAGMLAGSVTYVTPGSTYAELATGPDEAEFRMLVVDPTVRKRGVGSALVRTCLDRARAQARSTIRLSTDPAMTDAHRLYEHLGFVRTPDRDWHPAPHIRLLTYAVTL